MSHQNPDAIPGRLGGRREMAEPAPEVAEAIRRLDLVDHHCHGVVLADLDRSGFETLMSEGGAPPEGLSNFDTPVGLAIRRHCAPVLDLEPHAGARTYLDRRAELGTVEVTRRLLGSTGTTRYLVDTGFRPETLTPAADLARAGGGTAREIVRLEAVAEALAATGVEADDFDATVGELLADTVHRRGAVGVKSIAAYRVGFRFDPSRPTPAEVTRAAATWLAAGPVHTGAGSSGWRLADPVLTRALWWAAVDLGLPIQLHVGFGDADVRLHQVDPSLLGDWLAAHRVPVMLLHCWPYQRTAGYLAAVHPHVHLDVGLALPYVGPVRAAAVLAEAAELAPFGKLLYSSDACGLPELYHLGALTFRRALGDLLERRVAEGEWATSDAVRIAGLIGHGNAARIYRLDPS